MTKRKKREDGAIEITKYENRRLYDWSQSKYITLDDVIAMVQEGKTVIVVNRPTGEDITASTLLTCIMSYHDQQQVISMEELYAYVRRIKHVDTKAA